MNASSKEAIKHNHLCPFMILKLIRDGVITTYADLLISLGRPNSLHIMQINKLITGLYNLGLIELEEGPTVFRENTKFKPSKRIFYLQETLGISLSQLADFGVGSFVSNPIFGITKIEKNFDVFVAMPFLDELRPVYDDHIIPVASRVNASIARADDFFHPEL